MSSYRMCHRLLFVALFLSFPALAFADTVQGRVATVSPGALDMTVYDSQGRPYPNTLHLKVDSRTRLNGFSSATNLRKQDAVSVDVRQEKTGIWRADSVSLLQGLATAQPVTTRASPSLMDALKSPGGQKIIRNGVTGAVTGAVASSATGGKAGKGALIGAGVGVAGGLLADLFSQRSQPQSSSSTVASDPDTRY